MSSNESALVVVVPEADAVVGSFRDRYDPSATAGVPAHITLLYPFKPPAEVGANVLKNLQKCFAGFVPFGFSLAAIRRFPGGVLYLTPEPDEPFRQLTLALWAEYPEVPPYGGKFDTVVPHLTVALADDDQQLDSIADDFSRAAHGKLPVTALATAVALMDNAAGHWQIRTTFALGVT
jgi:2'-5' RNA ligase